MRRAFVLGLVVAVVAEAAIAAVVIGSGVVDVAARRHGPVDRVLAWASTRSIAHHASSEPNPLAGDPGAARRGLERYRDDCLKCHGAPGAHPEEFAAGLHPPAPDLADPRIQSSFTDGMLYGAVAGGIGSTGMPAFGSSHRPEEIWSIVAFLRHLPALRPEEKQALAREGGEGHAPNAETAAPARSPGAAEPGGPGHPVRTIRITGFKFVPATLEAHVGDVVEWKNEDFTAHTATADDHGFDTGQIDGGQSRRVVVRKKGEFPYFCRYHLAMKGTLVVQ